MDDNNEYPLREECKVRCYTCNLYVKNGDWVLTNRAVNRGISQVRHLKCAIKVHILDWDDIPSITMKNIKMEENGKPGGVPYGR